MPSGAVADSYETVQIFEEGFVVLGSPGALAAWLSWPDPWCQLLVFSVQIPYGVPSPAGFTTLIP